MLTSVNPKLPMRNKQITKAYYLDQLGFEQFGGEYEDYLMVQKDEIQLHFFLFKNLDPKQNYGQVYIRTNDIDTLHQTFIHNGVKIHPNGSLETKPWGMREFALLDPDTNLLTFGQDI